MRRGLRGAHAWIRSARESRLFRCANTPHGDDIGGPVGNAGDVGFSAHQIELMPASRVRWRVLVVGSAATSFGARYFRANQNYLVANRFLRFQRHGPARSSGSKYSCSAGVAAHSLAATRRSIADTLHPPRAAQSDEAMHRRSARTPSGCRATTVGTISRFAAELRKARASNPGLELSGSGRVCPRGSAEP